MKRGDWILIAGVLLIAVVAFFALRQKDNDGAVVTIRVHGEVYTRVRTDEYQTIVVHQDDGSENVIVIDEDGVKMASSTCKNQICVNTGVIDPKKLEGLSLGNTIVCLPNAVTIEIGSGETLP